MVILAILLIIYVIITFHSLKDLCKNGLKFCSLMTYYWLCFTFFCILLGIILMNLLSSLGWFGDAMKYGMELIAKSFIL